MIMLPGAAKNAPSKACAAGNAPSMTWIAILTASLAYLNHTCSKFGSAILATPTWRIFGSAILAAPTWQPKIIKEFQVSRAKTKNPPT